MASSHGISINPSLPAEESEVLRAAVGAGARPLRQASHGESARGLRGGTSGDEPTRLLAARMREVSVVKNMGETTVGLNL